jgi:predicted enzyme related to lactoylglutathione lyase
MPPGSVKGMHLVVKDIEEARAAITARGAVMSEVQDVGGVLYSWFEDPDGNLWTLQQWPESYTTS